MLVVSAETVLDLAVVVDPDAEPADFDAALAHFLLSFVRNQRPPGEASPAGEVDPNCEARER